MEVTLLVDWTPEHLKIKKVPVRAWLLKLRSWPESHGHFDAAININAKLGCFRGHIAQKNSTPYHLRGWCQAERQWTLHLPLCPDTFRYYMQEMCFSRKARCFRNCCNAIERSLLIPCAWSKLTTTDRKSQKSPGKGMFGRLLWNWKHCLQVQCVTSLWRSFMYLL